MKMKKNIKFYIIAWAILLALFNLIAFISPGWAAFEKYSGSFWTGYIFITLAFVGQLVCSLFAFKEDKKEKFFLSLPLITLSYTGLILTLVFGTLCMLVSFLPYWVAVIICAVILAVYAIAVLKAKAAAEISSATGEKVKARTFFIRSLTVDCENLLAKAKSEQAKTACNKVYDAVRYSDPMSSDELSSVEEKISAKISELSTAVTACDDEKITALADETVLLVKERNNKCKVLK